MLKRVKDILFELDLIVPPKYILDGDNCGLLIGDPFQPVTACVLALDVTDDIIELALKQKAELIITHHPIIYNALTNIPRSSIVHRIIRNNLNVICVHSNLDTVDDGVNDVLSKMINLVSIKVLKGTYGMGRIGRLKNDLTGFDLARYSKAVLRSPSAQVVFGDNIVSRVAVLGGAGGNFCMAAFDAGADAFITGEVKHHDYIYAINSGKTLITVGHNYSEVQVLNTLKAKLKTVLNEVVFIVDESYGVIDV